MRASIALPLVAALLAPAPAAQAAASRVPTLTLRLADQASRLWSEIPEQPTGEEDRVERLGGTSAACAAEALRQARSALTRGELGRVALRTLGIGFDDGAGTLKAQKVRGAAQLAEVFDLYLASGDEDDFTRRMAERTGGRPSSDGHPLYDLFARSRADQVVLPALGGAGPVAVAFDLRAVPQQPGRLHAAFLATGHARCGVPAAASPSRRLGRWQVIGIARLEAGDRAHDDDAGTAEVKWKVGAPRYMVIARCGGCTRDKDEKPETVAASGAACGACAPLDAPARGWGEEAAGLDQAAAESRAAVQRLEQELGALRQQMSTPPPRRPRGAEQERRRALSTDIAAKERERARALAGVTEAQDQAAACRQAEQMAREASERCRQDCEERNQQQAEAAAATPPATSRGGWRSNKKILIGGGAAVVAGVALAAGGGGYDYDDDDDSPPVTSAPRIATFSGNVRLPSQGECTGQSDLDAQFTPTASGQADLVLRFDSIGEDRLVLCLSTNFNTNRGACMPPIAGNQPSGGASLAASYRVNGGTRYSVSICDGRIPASTSGQTRFVTLTVTHP